MEAYDQKLAEQLIEIFQTHRLQATEITKQDLQSLPYWQKVRNATARLFAPYL